MERNRTSGSIFTRLDFFETSFFRYFQGQVTLFLLRFESFDINLKSKLEIIFIETISMCYIRLKAGRKDVFKQFIYSWNPPLIWESAIGTDRVFQCLSPFRPFWLGYRPKWLKASANHGAISKFQFETPSQISAISSQISTTLTEHRSFSIKGGPFWLYILSSERRITLFLDEAVHCCMVQLIYRYNFVII